MFPGSVKTSSLSAVLDRNAGKLINSAFIKPGSEGGGAWRGKSRSDVLLLEEICMCLVLWKDLLPRN